MIVVRARPGPTLYSGPFRIVGTVETPDGGVYRVVHLYRELEMPRAGNLHPPRLVWVASERSTPGTGAFEFTRISGDYRYTIRAYDETGQYDPVTKGGLIPEPME